MSRRLPVALLVALTLPAVASADVRISVPSALLGGRVAPAKPLPPPDPAVPGVVGNEVELESPVFWELVWPDDADAMPAPEGIEIDCGADVDATDCGLWGDDAATADTNTAAVTAVPPPSTTDVSRALRPAIGSWMVDQTPRLSWTPTAGATHYNVQIYLGPRRVASAWTTSASLTVPPRVIDQGRYYMWSVWPATGPRSAPTYGPQVGRSVFGVVLRPRVVFRSTATGVVGEVRPRIPGGLLRVSGPTSVTRGLPKRLRIGSASRIRLKVSRRSAERLVFRLVDVGNRPPRGLRAP